MGESLWLMLLLDGGLTMALIHLLWCLSNCTHYEKCTGHFRFHDTIKDSVVLLKFCTRAVTYRVVKSLCGTGETNAMLCVSYNSIKKKFFMVSDLGISQWIILYQCPVTRINMWFICTPESKPNCDQQASWATTHLPCLIETYEGKRHLRRLMIYILNNILTGINCNLCLVIRFLIFTFSFPWQVKRVRK